MSVTIGCKIDGTKETLKLLKEFEPELRKEFARNATEIAKPIIDAARSRYPDKILSGMRRNWSQGKKSRRLFPYTATRARSGIKVKIGTGKKAVSVITISQMNPAAAIIDMAGKANAGTGIMFNQNLTNAFGKPSRVMWPSATAHITEVTANMADLVHEAEKVVSSKLAAYG